MIRKVAAEALDQSDISAKNCVEVDVVVGELLLGASMAGMLSEISNLIPLSTTSRPEGTPIESIKVIHDGSKSEASATIAGLFAKVINTNFPNKKVLLSELSSIALGKDAIRYRLRVAIY